MSVGIFTLVAVIMLVMAGASAGYLLRARPRSAASQSLLRFFLCVGLSAIATILCNLPPAWAWAFAPIQDFFLILGGVFLVQFAFAYPQPRGERAARWALGGSAAFAAIALTYSVYFALTYWRSLPLELDESLAYYLLTPVAMLGIILLLFWRSVSESRLEVGEEGRRGVLASLLQPQSLPATGLRNLGLGLSAGLVPVLVFVLKPALPEILASFAFNLGTVVAISAVMLAYLNYAPEPTTVTAKLVGISLVSTLLLLGATCITILHYLPGLRTTPLVLIFICAVLVSSAFVLLVFPAFFRATLLEPLSRLLEGVQAVDAGSWDHDVPVRFDDELGRLTRAFNRMAHSIRDLTLAQEERAEELERAVAARTVDLQLSNQRLIEAIARQQQAGQRLDLQLGYEHALAEGSRILLTGPDDPTKRVDALTQALAALRTGAAASRCYLVEHYLNDQQVSCLRLRAEACAPGVNPHLPNPANQRFPLSDLPEKLVSDLQAGDPVSGPTASVFTDHPMAESLLQQDPPLLSVLFFPVHLDGRWWGFVGFDDCERPREWGGPEIVLLRTAAEMVGGTLQRWEIGDRLTATLDGLEQRVSERTASLNSANQQLVQEASARQAVQTGLERRLQAERFLARSAAQLVEAPEVSAVLPAVLQDLGELLQATSIAVAAWPSEENGLGPQVHAWPTRSTDPERERQLRSLLHPAGRIIRQIGSGEPRIVEDLLQAPAEVRQLGEALAEAQPACALLWPMVTRLGLTGLLAIYRRKSDQTERASDLQILEVFTGLLSGVLERDRILRTLETRVAEQTRELSALYEMTMLTERPLEISDILTPALNRIQEIVQSDAACIHLGSPQEQSLRLISHAGLPPEAIIGLEEIAIGESFSAWLRRPDPDNVPSAELPAGIPDPFCFPGPNALLMGKLRAAGSTLGLISCYRSDAFTPSQASILAVIGELLGVVVENHRLTRQAEKLATVHERQRLARELHDAVSQSLYSLSLFARAAKDAREVGDEAKLLDSLEQLEHNSIQALREMRLLLYQLRSIALEDGSFEQAVRARLEMVELRLGIETTLGVEPDLVLEAGLEQELFRIVTEALNNSLHYASATRVAVGLGRAGGRLVLAVEDNGVGFDPERTREGMGLQSIRERLRAFQGTFEINSHPGRGTSLRMSIPEGVCGMEGVGSNG